MTRKRLLVENMTAFTADIKQFHASFGTSLLRLEENCFFVVASGTRLVRPRKRWIRSNILGHTSSFASGVTQDIAEYAGRLCLLGVLAGSAGKLQFVSIFVLLGIQHVGAFGAKTEGNLFEFLGAGARVRRS